MPDTSSGWTSSDTAAAAQVISAGINYASAAGANRKGRRWAEDMYARQRTDALADWAMQNDYNSPAAQMKRLKEAGLNPNLVYGDGAKMASSVVKSSSEGSWRPQSPSLDLAPAMSTLFQQIQLRNTEQQTDNLKAQKEVLLQEAILKAAQTASTISATGLQGVQTAQGKFNLKMAEQLQNVTLETASEQLRQIGAQIGQTEAGTRATEAGIVKTKADTQYTLDQNERQAAINAQNLQIGAENILTIRLQRAKTEDERQQIKAQIDNIKNTGTLQALDILLKEKGVQPGDELWQRALAQVLGKGSLSENVERIKKNVERIPMTPRWMTPGYWKYKYHRSYR